MTYDTYERSIEDGRPIHLYRFTLGSTVWRYTSADEDLIIDGATWKAVPIRDDGVKLTGTASVDALSITASDSIGPAQVYASSPPAEAIAVERLGIHEGLTVPIINYYGEITQVTQGLPGQVSITCQTVSASMRRNGLRIGYQRSCPYALYDQATCRVNKASFAVAGVITDVAGYNVTVPAASAHPNAYFKGGLFEWTHPTQGLRAMFIEDHVGNLIGCFGDTSDLTPGQTITLYPGCQRTVAACEAFGNLANYGGFPWMPGKSPFDGTPFY